VNRRVLTWLGGVLTVCLVGATPARGDPAYPDGFTGLGGIDLPLPDAGPDPGPRAGLDGFGSGPGFGTVELSPLGKDTAPQPLTIFVWTVLGLFVSLGVAQHRRVRTLRTRLPWSTEQREAILKIVDRNRPAAGDEEWREVDSPW